MTATASLPSPATARMEWKQGWPVVIASASGMAIGGPLVTSTISLFIVPLEAQFGWTRAAISSGMTVNAVIAVLFSSLMGAAVDRYGSRRIGLMGVIAFSCAFAMLATNSGSLVQWWLLWLLLSISMLTVKPTVWVAAVASRFETSRGIALAATLCGSTMASILAPPYAQWLIDHYGWRGAYVGLAVASAILVFPLLFVAFHGKADLARATRRRGQADAAQPQPSRPSGAYEALRSPTFLRLALACGFSYFAITGTTIHFAPILKELGLVSAQVVVTLSAFGAAALAGRLLAGFWLDRFSARLFGFACFAMPAVGFGMLLVGDGSVPSITIAVVAIGIASGAEMETAAFLIAKHFGMNIFGLLLGTILGLLSLMAGTAPVLFGYLHDTLGTYEPSLWIALPLSICASGLMLSIADHVVPAAVETGTDSDAVPDVIASGEAR